MAEEPDVLHIGFGGLFRLRGMLDPTQAIPGLGASLSEVLALQELAADGSTQQQLGARLGLEKSTVSRLVDAMTRKGWVVKRRDPQNRRYQVVRLTADGARLADDVARAMRERHARVLAALTPAERQAVAVGLPALIRVLAADLDATHRD